MEDGITTDGMTRLIILAKMDSTVKLLSLTCPPNRVKSRSPNFGCFFRLAMILSANNDVINPGAQC